MFANRGTIVCAAFALSLAAAAPVAAQSVSCKEFASAMIKQTVTPYHAYMSTTAGYNQGKAEQSEVISTADAMYVQVHGKWRRSPFTAQNVKDMQKALADSVSRNYTCTRVGSESLNGASTTRYHVKGRNEEGEIGEEIWLASNGLVKRVDMDMDVGGGAMGKSHSTMRYEYGNVQAPPGVK